ncbi:MAG: alginate export family protein [Deltaproteobacteria bacterium]|nr:alginate export family protein [Deltaproteobacteria bacterium]
MSRRPRWLLLLIFFLPLVSGRIALAEESASALPEAWRLEKALGLPDRLSVTGDFRLRYEYLDNQFRAGSPGDDQILALRTRIRVGFRFTDWLSIAAEFQDSRAYLADDNTPVGTGLVNAAELLRAYFEFSFEGPFGGAQQLQFGRVTMNIGSRRLVARNRFRNTSNAFTGLNWRWQGEGVRELRAFYALPVLRLPSDSDRLRNNDVQFDDDNFDYQFWGLFYGDELPWGDAVELYAFGLYEKETYDTTDGETIPRRKLGTPGFRLLRSPEAGRLDYELETALQIGTAGSSVTGPLVLDHFAHFHHLTLGYTFARPWSPRLLLHYDYASGDRDPFDATSEHFDSLFGARRFEYGPTSIYGAFARSNVNTPGIRLQLRPGPGWTAFVDYRAVWLASPRDEWVPTGVRDITGRSGSFVGQQVEMRVRWRPLPGNVLLEAGYAHLFAGEFIDNAPNANGGDSNYVYSQVVLDF